MTIGEAIAFIRPAVGPASGAWADIGAGSGTFTEALAAILGPTGSVVAVDRDPGAIAALERLTGPVASRAAITAVAGDLADLNAIPELGRTALDGVLFATSLHYQPNPEKALATAGSLMRPGGRVVVVEYDRASRNPWVPHPLPTARLRRAFDRAGLGAPEIVARRPSAYQGELYCAVAFVVRDV